MVSPKTIIDNLTLTQLNRWFERHKSLRATLITPPFFMPNVDPQWSKAGNLWDSTESEITATGALTGPGYIHMIILEDEEDDVEPPSA